MHHKDIKRIVKDQLQAKYPNWKKLKVKEKKKIARMVLEEAIEEYDFGQEVTSPVGELLGIAE